MCMSLLFVSVTLACNYGFAQGPDIGTAHITCGHSGAIQCPCHRWGVGTLRGEFTDGWQHTWKSNMDCTWLVTANRPITLYFNSRTIFNVGAIATVYTCNNAACSVPTENTGFSTGYYTSGEVHSLLVRLKTIDAFWFRAKSMLVSWSVKQSPGSCVACTAGKYKRIYNEWLEACEQCPPNSNAPVESGFCICDPGFSASNGGPCTA